MQTLSEVDIIKGITFDFGLFWAGDERNYLTIEQVLSLTPVRLQVTAHGIPDGWPVSIECVPKPSEMNVTDYRVTVIDDDTIELNDLLGSCWRGQWSAGGVVSFLKPADLVDFAARAMIRTSIYDEEPLLTFHSDPGESPDGSIVIDAASSSITFVLADSVTALQEEGLAVWDAELIDPAGRVISLFRPSPVRFCKEVTR